MELLNPVMLWGVLAISIPILLHFWHQKKGKVIEWAAMQWLIEKDLQQSKGIRLDNLLLLILRCILLLILALLLSKPILNWFNKNDLSRKIHLVQNHALVIENFKFELEEAKKKDEKIYWIIPNAEPIKDFESTLPQTDFDATILQGCINRISQSIDNEQLELYLVNSPKLNQLPNIYLPSRFKVHPIVDSSKSAKPFLQFADDKFVFVGSDNQLVISQDIDGKFQPKPVHTGEIKILYLGTQKKSVEAALKAVNEVYGIAYSVDYQEDKNKKYDLVYEADSPLSEGEKMIEEIIKKFNLNPVNQPLSQQQLNSLFKIEKQTKKNVKSWFSEVLMALFISVLGFERWLASRKNA